MSEGQKRRRFLQALAGVPLLPAALARAAAPTPAPSPSAVPSPSPPPSAVPGPLADALTEAARRRFGTHIGQGDLDEIKKAIQGNLDAAERLREVKLTNGDDLVTIFEARPRGRRGEVSTGRGRRPVRERRPNTREP